MVAAHNWVISIKNHRRTSGIAARFWLRRGRPLDPPIPLYSVVPPLPDKDNDDIDAGIEQNNPSGSTATEDDDVIFFDALAALPAVNDPAAASNTDATSDASLGPSANVDDVEPASNLTGLSADGSDAPLASDASLGLPAGRSNMPGNDDVLGVGPDDVDGNVAGLVGDGVSGDRPLGLLTGGNVGPQASPGGPNGSVDGIAPLAVETSLGLSAGRSSLQGDDDVLGMGPNNIDGNVTDPGNGASGDHTLGLFDRRTRLPTGIPRRNERFRRREQCPLDDRDGCRPDGRRTWDDGGGRWRHKCEFAWHQRHPSAAINPPLPPLQWQEHGVGLAKCVSWEGGDSSTGELSPGGCGRSASGCRAGRRGD